MRRTALPVIAATALATLAGPALAQPLLPLEPGGFTLPAPRTGGAPRDASSELFGAAITIHSAGGYDFLDSAPDVHIFGGTAFVGLNSTEPWRSMHVTTSQAQVAPHTFEFVIEWGMDDGGALISAGSLLGGNPITGLGFHVGEGAAPGHLIQWEDSAGFTIVGTSFKLFDLSGEDLLGGTGEFIASINGGAGLSGQGFAGGQDVSQFGAARAVATISVREAPAPSGLGVLAFGGAVLARRRRR